MQAVGTSSGFYVGSAFLLTEASGRRRSPRSLALKSIVVSSQSNVLVYVLVALGSFSYIAFLFADLRFNARMKANANENPV